MIESAPQPNKEESRRGFLKRAARIGTSVFAAGVIGGATGETVVGLIKKSTEPAFPINPAQEQVDARHVKYMESVAAGDPKTIEFATLLIATYSKELKENIEMQAAMTMQLTPSELDSGLHALTQSALFFFKQRQTAIEAQINSLKDPIQRYLKRGKSRSAGVSESPDDTPTATTPHKERSA